MDSRLLLFLVIACAVSRIDGQSFNSTAFTGNITNSACGTTKLCPVNCNPANSSCFFASSQLQGNTTLFFELSGVTTGYVGLGLSTSQSALGPSIVFVCGFNSTTNNSFFFTTATNTSTGFTASSVNATVLSVQGAVTPNTTGNGNLSLVQCTFSTSNNLTTTRSAATTFFIYILTGSLQGGNLGTPFSQFVSSKALDLTSPTSNLNTTNSTTTTTSPTSSGINVLTNPLAHALAILLSLYLLY